MAPVTMVSGWLTSRSNTTQMTPIIAVAATIAQPNSSRRKRRKCGKVGGGRQAARKDCDDSAFFLAHQLAMAHHTILAISSCGHPEDDRQTAAVGAIDEPTDRLSCPQGLLVNRIPRPFRPSRMILCPHVGGRLGTPYAPQFSG